MVFYLKYRPKKISELDSLDLQKKLEAVLSGKLPNDIPHAFLFTGSKGLGKTSTARIVSKVINCTNRREAEFEPCNKCDSCKAIDSGSSLDVLEIDGASNRGIDEIRDLREKIRLAPVSLKKKIYIIDEVHMLTTEAFNALLKTLEEPPIHAQFILCTTESQKIPETISSRCFNIRFIRATDEDLVHSFKRILKGEDIKADDAALIQIAKMSDGSFRDGAKILEEISAGNKNITIEAIEEKYNFSSVNKGIDELIEALKSKNAKNAIKIISGLSEGNTDFKLFIEQLINTLHSNLILEIEKESSDALQIKNLITLLVGSYSSIKYAVLPQLPLELAIIEWCSDDDSELIKESSKEVGQDSSLKEKTEKNPVKLDSKNEKIDVKKTSSERVEHDNILDELIEAIKKENFSIAGVLRGCSVEKYGDSELVLSTQFKFHRERLNDKKILDLLEAKLKEINGEKIKIKVELKE